MTWTNGDHNFLKCIPVPASGGMLGLGPFSVGSPVRVLLAAGSDAACLVKNWEEPAPGLGFLA